MKNTKTKVSTGPKEIHYQFKPNKFKMFAREIEIRGINGKIHNQIK